jgi:sugar phosphate isomerase/epimerase
MKIALIPDEYTQDPFTAFELGTKWGYENYEIRQVYRWRVPVCPQWVNDKTVAAVKAYGVKVTGISPGLFKPVMKTDGSKIPISVDTPVEIRRQIDEMLPQCFELANRLGTKNITVFALTKAAAGTTPPAIVVESLAEAAGKAAAAGFQLLLENGGGSWADSGKASKAIIDAVNSEALRLTWDAANVANAQLPEDPVKEGYALVKSVVRNVHVKDTKVVDGKSHWVMLGDGVVDWPAQIKRLKADKYGGFLTLEPHLQYETEKGLVGMMETYLARAKTLSA